MAVLYSHMNDIAMHLVLTNKDKSAKWISYELKIINIYHEEENILFLLKSDELYFDDYVEHEVPALCDSLLQLAEGKIEEFTFEPIDEKDFRIELKNINGLITTNIFFDEVQVFDSYLWNINAMIGVRFKIRNEDIIQFSNELLDEYKAILYS